MRESLGIALDSDSISTALVDADTPLLGPVDQHRHRWSADGGVPSAQSSARALVSAAGVAIDRASRSDLHPTSIGVVCERSDVRDLISETSSPLAGDNVVVVNGLDARLAYLRTVDTLAGVSPILAFWGEGEETVIAAIDPLSGTIDSAHRFLSSDLFANNETFTATFALIVAERDAVPKMLVAMRSPEQSREMAAVAAEQAGLGFVFLGEPGQLAIGAALVAAAHLAALHGVPLAGAIGAPVVTAAGARHWAPLAVVSTFLVLGGLLIGLLITLAPDKASTATTDRTNGETTPSIPGDEDSHDSGGPAVPVQPGHRFGESGESVDVLPSLPTTLNEVLPPCDPVAPAFPAGLRRSDPDLPSATTPPQAPGVDDCVPTRSG
ncbi:MULTISPECIES: hypothetical protein [Rhodococcus]|uniref:DUF7159 domain-containing protein n=1 Tax=Rhodococcus qingshengii JCM 15477 TaxID=1303681 RepID=A0AB38R7R9_RHOSG|nr:MULTISPECIES: hypothetical protein [Rhodococcus]MCD2131380.1 hypothetical protein [Rhodococcus qingshengii]UPU40799.1 hypothetical protein M0639_17125 [Rhodococcus qingshengii JCM 15477]